MPIQLAELPRTTGFRVAILLMALLGVASLSSFSLLYEDMARFLNGHLDGWLKQERGVFLDMTPDELVQQLRRHARIDVTSSWPLALYEPNGRQLAGAAMKLPRQVPQDGRPFDFQGAAEGHEERFRGIVERLPDGKVLLISERLWWAQVLDHVLIQRAVSALGIGAAIGLGVAAFKGAETQRRIAAFTRVTQQVVTGDLSGRLPVRNRLDDLDQLAGIVNSVLDHSERLLHQVGSFRDAVAHDLSTPLARLHVTLEGARARAHSADDYRTAIDIALAESRRLSGMFAAVRRLSEIEGRARRAGFAPVDLSELAADAFDFYQPVAEDRSIALALADATQHSMILGDRELLFEALGNLLDNAIKFTPAGGSVTLSVHDSGAPGFEVLDTGPGISPAEQDAVLRRFYRPAVSRGTKGSGLGLAIVSAIADLHGMDLSIALANPGCRISLRRALNSVPAAA
jgi:signal transduction histidine kinase